MTGARPLAGRTVVVTRAAGQSGELTGALESLGAAVIELPAIEIRPVEDTRALDAAARGLAGYRVLVFGSKNAAELFFERVRAAGAQVTIPVACVGAKTRAWVETHAAGVLGGVPLLAPDVFRAEALVEVIAGVAAGGRVLFPRAAEGRETLIDALAERGIGVDAPIAYHIATAPPAERAVIDRLHGADAFTFLSGETLRAFLEVVPEAEARALLARAIVAVIGPVAAEKAAALGIRTDVVPETATVQALAGALAAAFARKV